MLSQQLNLELDSLTTLQRKLLTDIMRKRHPHFWSHFRSHFQEWETAKKNLELFLQNHSSEFLEALKKSGFNGYESNILLEVESPWNGKCKNTDIEVLILYKGVKLPICRRCWNKIANSNIEWGEPLNAKED